MVWGYSHNSSVSKWAAVFYQNPLFVLSVELVFAIMFSMLMFVDAGSQPEELNKKAVTIINRVRDKLTGIVSVCAVNFYLDCTVWLCDESSILFAWWIFRLHFLKVCTSKFKRFVTQLHTYCLSLSLRLQWYNGSVTHQMHSSVTKHMTT